MSDKEIEVMQKTEQHEKITLVAKQVAIIFKWWPLIFGIVMCISSIGTVAIMGYKYDTSLVKQPQFLAVTGANARKVERDSIRIDMVNTRIDTIIHPKQPIKHHLNEIKEYYNEKVIDGKTYLILVNK